MNCPQRNRYCYTESIRASRVGMSCVSGTNQTIAGRNDRLQTPAHIVRALHTSLSALHTNTCPETYQMQCPRAFRLVTIKLNTFSPLACPRAPRNKSCATLLRMMYSFSEHLCSASLMQSDEQEICFHQPVLWNRPMTRVVSARPR